MGRRRLVLVSAVTSALLAGSGAAASAAGTQVNNGNDGTPNPNEQIDYQTAEQYLNVAPGQTATQGVSCPSGYYVADGSAYIQSLDQGTGVPADIRTLASSATSPGTWTFTLANPDTGNAHVQLEIDCVGSTTNTGAQIVFEQPVGNSETAGAGFSSVQIDCPGDEAVIAPGYTITGGPGNSQIVESEPQNNGNSWVLGFYSPTGGDAISVTGDCVGLNLSDGQALADQSFSETNTIGQTGPTTTSDEYIESSPGSDALIGTFSLPQDGSIFLDGREPQARSELFHVINTTGNSATFDEGDIQLSITTDTPPAANSGSGSSSGSNSGSGSGSGSVTAEGKKSAGSNAEHRSKHGRKLTGRVSSHHRRHHHKH